jgi:formylglycine-generating enzyme required for sulfatase activity
MCSEHANFFDCQRELIKVGSLERRKSIYGAMNMAGNVREWVADTYEEDYYQISPYKNPQGPSSGVYKVARGGCWKYYQVSLYIRYWFAQMTSNDIVGFRCAQDAD